jgi:hypothetical protein
MPNLDHISSCYRCVAKSGKKPKSMAQSECIDVAPLHPFSVHMLASEGSSPNKILADEL